MYVFKNKVDSAGTLEDKLHVNDKRMINLQQNEFFKINTLHGVFIQDHIFADAFESVVFLGHRKKC